MTTTITRLPNIITHRVLFWFILLLGAGLRLFRFPNWPLGFNQDEISAGYESWSLVHTGAQSWGERFPVYFSSGGAGQNVLYAYLNMPFMAIFGLANPLGTRLLEVIIGIATIPLMYVTVRRLQTRKVALIAMFLTAVMPWHYMLSRWGLESNILPFVALLGMYLIVRALQTQRTWVTILALIPLALACYAYGIACIPVAVFILLLLVTQHRLIRGNLRAWLIAISLFAIVVAPFALFLGKQYLHLHYPFEQHLPFSLPDLNRSRLADLQNTDINPLVGSLDFFIRGSNDYSAWNGLPVLGGDPFPAVFLLFALGDWLWRLIRTMRQQRVSIAAIGVIDIWVLSAIPVCFLFPVNINEINILYLPVIILAASFIGRLLDLTATFTVKALTRVLLTIVLLIALVPPFATYFGKSYPPFTASNFNPGVQHALELTQRQAAGNEIYVSNSISLNYLQTLWYLKIDPAVFQAAHPSYDHPNFENFIFAKGDVNADRTYWYLLRADESPLCAQPKRLQNLDGGWKIGQCTAGQPVQ